MPARRGLQSISLWVRWRISHQSQAPPFRAGLLTFSRAVLDDCYLLDTPNGPVLDRCKSVQDHMVAPLEPGKEYRECRVALADLLPAGCANAKGRWRIEFTFVPDEKEKIDIG